MQTSCHELFSPHCAAMLKLKFCTVNMAQSGKITSHTHTQKEMFLYIVANIGVSLCPYARPMAKL